VISLRVNDNWNLITRTIVPIERQPQLAPGLPDRATGLDDTQLSLFLSPAGVGNLLWGVGPILRLPTAGNDSLGAGKFSIGPAAVIAREGHWVAGALIRRRAGKVIRVGKEPVNTHLQRFRDVVHPHGGPAWSIKFTVQLLLPKGHKK
jgi:hypothetical protein